MDGKTSNQIEETLERIERAIALNGKNSMNMDECARFIGIKKTTLYNKCQRREIPHYKSGNLTFFSKKEVEEWMISGTRIRSVSEDKAYAENFCVRSRKAN